MSVIRPRPPRSSFGHLTTGKLFPVPLHIAEIRPRTAIFWKVDPPEGRAEKAAEFGRYLIVRNEQAKVIRQCNQMSVEQPVSCRRESQTVLDNVRTSIRDRHDVCGLSLCSSASVDNAQAGDGTGVIVCIHDGTPKRRISDSAIDQELLDPSFLFRDRRPQHAWVFGSACASSSSSRTAFFGARVSCRPARTIAPNSPSGMIRTDLPCKAAPIRLGSETVESNDS